MGESDSEFSLEFTRTVVKSVDLDNLSNDNKASYEALEKLWDKRDQIAAKFIKLAAVAEQFEQGDTDIHTVQGNAFMLDKYVTKFENVQAQIEDNPLSEEDDEEENEITFRTFLEKIKYIIATITSESIEQKSKAKVPATVKIKLPQQQIPEFNGDLTSWRKFRDTFVSLIHDNTEIPDVQKFHYLLSALKKGSDNIIKEIPITNENYKIAWKVLEERYDNRTALMDAHLDKLFGLKQVSKDNVTELRSLVDTVQTNVRALCTLKVPISSWDVILVYMVNQKLDTDTKKQWQLQQNPKEDPSYEKLMSYLNKRCNVLESIQPRKVQKDEKDFKSIKAEPSKFTKQKSSSVFTTETKNVECQLCKSSHRLFYCPEFLKLHPKERKAKVREMKSCYKCLGTHVKDCTQRGVCKICQKADHNTLLHYEEEEDKSDDSKKDKKILLSHNSCIQVHCNKSLMVRKHTFVMMGTAQILMLDSRGIWHQVRALLDSASQSCFITERLAQTLALKKQKINAPVSGISGIKTSIKFKAEATFKSRVELYQETTDFLIVSKIANETPSVKIDTSRWMIPCELQLADSSFCDPGKIDVLIGTQYFYDIIKSGKVSLGTDKPSMLESKLGWIVAGGMQFNSTAQSPNISLFVQADVQNPAKSPEVSEEDLICEQHFQRTTRRDSTGRYVVKLPFKPNMELGESQSIAERRLWQLKKQFDRNPQIKQQYFEFIQEYIDLGHAEIMQGDAVEDQAYYIPHHPVIKPSSTTTKLRVVFNASSKTSNQLSLNDILMTGPNIQTDLRTLLIRFLIHKYVLVADIEKMFRQMMVEEADRKFLRILFFDDSWNIIKISLNTITYGTICAPYQSVRVLKQLAIDEAEKFPKAVQPVTEDFYMDNQMSGCDDLTELISIQQQVNQMFESAGMKLRKFAANNPELLRGIPSDDIEKLITIQNHDNTTNALGLIWDPEADQFMFKTPEIQTKIKWTKRLLLSELKKIFDPLGWISPVAQYGNFLMQEVWMCQIGWDTEVPEAIKIKWQEFYNDLPALQQLQKPRWVLPFNHTVQLVGFADASLKGFGAVLYIVSRSQDGQIAVRLLYSQSRVAPQPNKKRKKPITLPKLELNAALELARITDKYQKIIPLNFESVILFSDSTITLCRLQKNPKEYVQYVARRIAEIQKLTKECHWKYVNTKHNPADIVSRGAFPSQIVNSSLWWNGPDFLHDPDYTYLEDESYQVNSTEEIDCLVVTAHTEFRDQMFHVSKCSDYSHLVRLAAWVQRFIHNCRAKQKKLDKLTGSLTYTEHRNAERILVAQVQKESFPNEFKSLSKGKSIDSSSKILSLNPQFKNGVIVVGGRLRNSLLTEEQKHPMILPHNHHFTKMLIRVHHIQTLHGGAQLTLNVLRNRFWIVHGKSTVKHIIRQCITCFKIKPRYIDQIMGDLPSERVQPNRPFAITGLDYCGYFHVMQQNKRSVAYSKVWVCIFVCFATKAVHLEPVTNLTTEAFRNCLTRFRARRGKCIILNSDNQSTFHGANKAMKNEIQSFLADPTVNQEIKRLCLNDNLDWRFIPPRCPHVGGLWESSVKSFKHHFKRIVGDSHLTLENFMTLVYSIEGCLNSRPLTPLSEDPEDYEVLTPAHFLIGNNSSMPPEPDFTNIADNRLSQYERIQKYKALVWKNWSRDYLNTLQQRFKWKIQKQELKPGDLVIVIEDNVPATKWLTARVVSTSNSPDGNIRMVDLKTPGSKEKLRRSIHRVCPLPVNEVE